MRVNTTDITARHLKMCISKMAFSSFCFSLSSFFSSLLLLGLLLLLDRSLGSVLGHSLVINGDHAGVDHLRAVLDNLLDETFLCQLDESPPGQRSSDLEPFTDDGRSDELVGGDLFVQFVVRGLVEEDEIVELVPCFSFGPLLLLGLSSAATRRFFSGSLGGLGVLLWVFLSTHGLRSFKVLYSSSLAW